MLRPGPRPLERWTHVPALLRYGWNRTVCPEHSNLCQSRPLQHAPRNGSRDAGSTRTPILGVHPPQLQVFPPEERRPHPAILCFPKERGLPANRIFGRFRGGGEHGTVRFHIKKARRYRPKHQSLIVPFERKCTQMKEVQFGEVL